MHEKRNAASIQRRGWTVGRVRHASASGTITSAPQKSPSQYVRTTLRAGWSGKWPPSANDSGPRVALAAVPAAIAAISQPTVAGLHGERVTWRRISHAIR